MKIEFGATASSDTLVTGHEAPRHDPKFIVSYPKAGPVLQGSYIFPKVESYGVWKIHSPKSVSEDC